MRYDTQVPFHYVLEADREMAEPLKFVCLPISARESARRGQTLRNMTGDRTAEESLQQVVSLLEGIVIGWENAPKQYDGKAFDVSMLLDVVTNTELFELVYAALHGTMTADEKKR